MGSKAHPFYRFVLWSVLAINAVVFPLALLQILKIIPDIADIQEPYSIALLTVIVIIVSSSLLLRNSIFGLMLMFSVFMLNVVQLLVMYSYGPAKVLLYNIMPIFILIYSLINYKSQLIFQVIYPC